MVVLVAVYVYNAPLAHAAITLVAHTIKQGNQTGSGTSPAIDTTGANLIVISVTDDTGTNTGTPTDSKSNTWTHLTFNTNGGVSTQLWYSLNPTVGSGHTFASANNNLFGSITVAAFSGAAASSPFDVENGSNTASASSLQTGSVTPSQDNSLVIYSTGDAWTGTLTANIGTVTDFGGLIGGNSFANGMAYQIQTTATAVNPTFSWTGGAARAEASIAVFKPAPASNTPQHAIATMQKSTFIINKTTVTIQ